MNIHNFYQPILTYFRTKRMTQFVKVFTLTGETQILDVGGSPFNWSLIKCEYPQLMFLNIYPVAGGQTNRIIADGRHLPFAGNSYDIVYSNSVIEHLGDWESQVAFAKEIRRVGRRYYVQTPNRRFFIEPHYITPFIHYLPKKVQRYLLRNFTVWGLITRPSQQKVDDLLQELRLLTVQEFQELFPDAEITNERFIGFVKSFVAMKFEAD